MSNLMLTRKMGQNIQVGGPDCVVEVLNVRHAEVVIRIGLVHEKLRIGNKYNVAERAIMSVVSIARGYVKLAFEAERSVVIVRTELLPCQ